MLAEVDPKSAEVIHENNTKRVIRALEFYHQNHSPISAHNEEQQERTSPYNLTYFVLNAPRELLYKRIDKRVDEMMTSGLVAEVQKLKDMGYHRGMVSMQGLGYKEILAYLDGEMPPEEAVRILRAPTGRGGWRVSGDIGVGERGFEKDFPQGNRPPLKITKMEEYRQTDGKNYYERIIRAAGNFFPRFTIFAMK